MTNIPSWFGQTEFYVTIITMWGFMISWVLVNFLRVGGIKWDIKKKIVGLKGWWMKRTGKIDPFVEKYGVKPIEEVSE